MLLLPAGNSTGSAGEERKVMAERSSYEFHLIRGRKIRKRRCFNSLLPFDFIQREKKTREKRAMASRQFCPTGSRAGQRKGSL